MNVPQPMISQHYRPVRHSNITHCSWCGKQIPPASRLGRPKQYCTQSCRQRAYEQRAAVQRGELPEDSVVLTQSELADLRDRLFQLRCAAEDIATAITDGANLAELHQYATEIAATAQELERLR